MDPYIGKMLDNRYEILELIGREAWPTSTRLSVTGWTGW